MAYIYYNPNPNGRRTDDCVIRAICKLTNKDWYYTYTQLSLRGFIIGDGRNVMDNYNRGNSYDNRYYDDRYGNDRYVRYEGDMHYSGDGNKKHMISLMEEAMDNATTKEEREKNYADD